VDSFVQDLTDLQQRALKERTFVTKVDQVLSQSASGRSEIIDVINRTQQCMLAPDDASRQINSVANNRQSLLDQVAALDPPTEPLRQLQITLQEALRHSQEADRHFADWVSNEAGWYFTWPVGCLGGDMPTDSFHDTAVSDSALASDAKARFCTSYNRWARQYGLASRTPGEI
jgi:hypothetical protein